MQLMIFSSDMTGLARLTAELQGQGVTVRHAGTREAAQGMLQDVDFDAVLLGCGVDISEAAALAGYLRVTRPQTLVLSVGFSTTTLRPHRSLFHWDLRLPLRAEALQSVVAYLSEGEGPPHRQRSTPVTYLGATPERPRRLN